MRSDRRGAIAVMTAILLTVLMMLGAIAIDMSRAFAMQSELRRAADAGALAGTLQLIQGRDTYYDSALAYTTMNKVMNGRAGAVEIENSDDIVYGQWDDVARTFTTDGVTLTTANAVRVTATIRSSFLVAKLFWRENFGLKATATAWTGQISSSGDCIKPFAMPYQLLMEKLGEPNATRDLTAEDLEVLKAMGRDDLRFELKAGEASGKNATTDQTGTGLPGNYYMVAFPPFWNAAEQEYQDTQTGKKEYRFNFATCSNVQIGPGDSLMTEPGNAAGPTIDGGFGYNNGGEGWQQGWCVGTTANNDAACRNADGTMGVPMKAIFWLTPEGVNGRDKVAVKMLASFIMDTVTRTGKDKAKVIGHFVFTSDAGKIASGPTGSLLQRIILVE